MQEGAKWELFTGLRRQGGGQDTAQRHPDIRSDTDQGGVIMQSVCVSTGDASAGQKSG